MTRDEAVEAVREASKDHGGIKMRSERAQRILDAISFDAMQEELVAYREEAMGGESVWALLLQARTAVLKARQIMSGSLAKVGNHPSGIGQDWFDFLAETEFYEAYRE